MACIATWSFGIQAVEVASAVVERGDNCVDAVEKGVNGTTTMSCGTLSTA